MERELSSNVKGSYSQSDLVATSSTRNVRIERLWLCVGQWFCRRWRAFFVRLEEQHQLDADNEAHIWLLHFLFLADLNQVIDKFVRDWNDHPLSGDKTNNRSPNVSGIAFVHHP